MERLSLVLCVVLACVAPAMAASWDGNQGGDWFGITTAWDAGFNWEGGENEFLTTKWSVDPGDVAWYGYGSSMPTITDGMDTVGGYIRVRNGGVITQEGGSVEFWNGSGTPKNIALYNAGTAWNISGGSLISSGSLVLGYDNWGSAAPGGSLNISGDGVVTIRDNGLNHEAELLINTGSVLSIADLGQLVVDADMTATIDGMIGSGAIVGIGGDLGTATVDGTYVVSIVPEPATMALLGLGALALRRKK